MWEQQRDAELQTLKGSEEHPDLSGSDATWDNAGDLACTATRAMSGSMALQQQGFVTTKARQSPSLGCHPETY